MRPLVDVSRLPQGREGRLLAVGLLVVAIGAVWAVLIMPLIDWYGAREQALQARMQYAARMSAIAADLPNARAAAASAALRAPPPNMILQGSSDPIAGAALESVIDGLTRDSGATLISTEASPAKQDGKYRRIGLHVTARASWDKLIHLLAAIEGASPRMSIGNLQIQAGPLGGPEQLLDMSFSVTAFRAGSAAASDSGADNTGSAP